MVRQGKRKRNYIDKATCHDNFHVLKRIPHGNRINLKKFITDCDEQLLQIATTFLLLIATAFLLQIAIAQTLCLVSGLSGLVL